MPSLAFCRSFHFPHQSPYRGDTNNVPYLVSTSPNNITSSVQQLSNISNMQAPVDRHAESCRSSISLSHSEIMEMAHNVYLRLSIKQALYRQGECQRRPARNDLEAEISNRRSGNLPIEAFTIPFEHVDTLRLPNVHASRTNRSIGGKLKRIGSKVSRSWRHLVKRG